MSKLFTWIFGAITGIVTGFAGGILLIAYSMVMDPEALYTYVISILTSNTN